VERLHALQQQSGDLALEEREYQGWKYFRRVERKGVNFLCLRESLLVFATQEPMLRQVLDLEKTRALENESPIGRQFRLLGVDRPLAALWINPRAFDRALTEKAAEAKGSQARALRTLLNYWNALEGVALTVRVERDISVSLSIRARLEELAPAARRFLSAAAEPSELWQRFPDDALFTVAGRLDFRALVDMVSQFVDDDARQVLRAMVEASVGSILGKDVVGELLPNLGPDWGLCVLAPPVENKTWVPQVVGALRVRPGDKGKPADLTLWNALNALATLAVFHHNSGRPGQLTLGSLRQDGVEVKYLANEEGFPPGFRPAFALKGGYLLVGSSPEAIGRFRAKLPEPIPVAAGERGAEAPGNRVPLLRASLSGWRQFLQDRRDSLRNLIAQKHQISEDDAGQRIDKLLAVLQLFDDIQLSQHSDPNRVVFELRVRPVRPLK
jgi:hypothetical protein